MVKTDLFKSHYIAARVPSRKLMIVLHGKGDSSKPFRKFNEELSLYDVNFLLLNAPKKYLDGYSWYGDPPYQKLGVMRVRKKLLQLLADLELQGWRPEDIFLLGFSQGCLISADLVMHYPKRLGGFVGVSGYFQFYPRWKRNLASNRNTPWLITHGTNDDVLPIEDTRFGVQKLKTAGISVDWIESDKKHDFEVKEYKLIRKWIQERF